MNWLLLPDGIINEQNKISFGQVCHICKLPEFNISNVPKGSHVITAAQIVRFVFLPQKLTFIHGDAENPFFCVPAAGRPNTNSLNLHSTPSISSKYDEGTEK